MKTHQSAETWLGRNMPETSDGLLRLKHAWRVYRAVRSADKLANLLIEMGEPEMAERAMALMMDIPIRKA